MDAKRLGIYLSDHHAGSVAGIALARRTESENHSNPVGHFLAALIPELRQDQRTLEAVMRALELRKDPLKSRVAWVMEKAGRLKLNGHWVRYSPLSRLIELEGLCTATEGRMSLWSTLARLQLHDLRLAGFDFESLVARGELQQAGLQRLRARAADVAFADEPTPFGAGEPAIASY
ncbi:hypothetical protein HUA74_14625 [Myxococcus sp. CA051A]|uniref:Uncharacterized protein n=1 Tax=Myxococcus llanfairpwllgwyngyllgogerychwyrndrobwllllantysiliogogogochensis TaxID=2590453 RepID=A0A540X2F6_9BACT|nr:MULTISPECIES: hypothetical protein [Myxococcus]NTX03952.1 hypothetical protein [Myxococcus sp. CA040A]NTX35704.1 hypothetical protein [Myxococcus sp. CA033]NTX53761.1 hypothetical protein [Myxococcus sp. CA039A]NTX61894.1 hypothetical protein [Myxococcus sp. CA051A]TQF15393.1 hypothetical protein FJV41_13715 [Myxococcus llanfairpwllgwyngyllgogerychwyrndrobwllllantysiliogogogochensis]